MHQSYSVITGAVAALAAQCSLPVQLCPGAVRAAAPRLLRWKLRRKLPHVASLSRPRATREIQPVPPPPPPPPFLPPPLMLTPPAVRERQSLVSGSAIPCINFSLSLSRHVYPPHAPLACTEKHPPPPPRPLLPPLPPSSSPFVWIPRHARKLTRSWLCNICPRRTSAPGVFSRNVTAVKHTIQVMLQQIIADNKKKKKRHIFRVCKILPT